MKLSLNWIKQYTPVDLPEDELVAKIGSQLGEVEGVEHLGPKYAGAVIVKVVDCVDHPNADRLHLCMVDDGGKTPDVTRDGNGYVQVVCGAPNVRADMLAIWLPPGATVPSTFDKDPFVLEARELRGEVSNGMLASSKELGLGDSHDGILEIDAAEWSPTGITIAPGVSFVDAYGLNDTVIDIENKMFTHRPDLFGQLGLAREVAGITNQQFTSPDWYKAKPEFKSGEGLELQVRNEAPELVPRLMAVAIKNVTVKPSPVWLQCELVRVGAKPINNIVDVTNYIMLLTAQPTHAYDYDKLAGHTLLARKAKNDETASLLNHKSYKFTDSDIVMADAEAPVGLAGVMGGDTSEVSAETTNIVLECANFDMYNVRRSSMRHGLFTDALMRFSKGQSPLQNDHVMKLLIQSIFDVAGGEVASKVFDEHNLKNTDWVESPVATSLEFINSRLGLELDMPYVRGLLEHVECTIEQDGESKFTVTAPFWRTDLAIAEDIVEEVGRLYGMDNLPLELPKRVITPAVTDGLLQIKTDIRTSLARAGANELLTYSFVHGDLLDKVGQKRDQAFELSNALSPDLQYLRFHGLPSLLDKVHANIKAGHDNFAIFELNKGHNLMHKDDDEGGVPLEIEFLDFVYASKKPQSGAPFYRARRYLDALAADLGLMLEYNPVTEDPNVPVVEPYDITRSAYVQVAGTDIMLGMVGEFKRSVLRNLKLPAYSAGFTVGPKQLLEATSHAENSYVPLSRYPKVEQDICFKVPNEVTYGELAAFATTSLGDDQPSETQLAVKPRDIYQRDDDSAHKQITFRIALTSNLKTMTDTEMSDLLNTLTEAAKQRFGAERI